ncbi:hypothetical protein G9A89_006105 [Geosiphon pyriformis]|nr:hypothetical protein G9A89_006105 [Geosiphon pyriformis]
MKKAAKVSGSNNSFRSVLPRKKRKGGVLENSSGGESVGSKIQNSHLWGSKTGDTTESNSIDMEEKCLVKETSFDYDKGSVLAKEDSNQTSTGLKVKTKKTLGKPLVVRKLFSKINGFGETSTLSKFAGIIRVLSTSKSSLAQASKKAEKAKILVNTNFKKSSKHSDWAVVIKKIPVGTSAEAVRAVLSKFGIIKLIKMQLVRLWQKAVIEFEWVDYADLVAAK